jgi:hypothetical protein
MTNIRAFSKLLSAGVVLAMTIGFTLACDGNPPTTGTIDEKGKVVATFNGEYRLGLTAHPCSARRRITS